MDRGQRAVLKPQGAESKSELIEQLHFSLSQARFVFTLEKGGISTNVQS